VSSWVHRASAILAGNTFQLESDLDYHDPLFNQIGANGLGGVAAIGVAAAVGNAVFHATGQRFRRLPIGRDNAASARRL
jgi:CO/xanthine dehydrogenase Mo-binding subunit